MDVPVKARQDKPFRGRWCSLKSGTGVSPVDHAQDARATNGNGNGNGGTGVPPVDHAQDARATIPPFDRRAPGDRFSLVSPAPESDIVFNEHSPRKEPALSVEELGSAFNRSGFGRGNNGQSL